jgi:hypothetical protein
MVHVMLPGLLATHAGGQHRFDIDAATVGEALHALPVADLVFGAVERSDPYLLIYLNDTNSLESGGMASPVVATDELRVISVLTGH